jgi:hypothetical protein
MIALLVFYSIGLLIPVCVGLREAFTSAPRLRPLPRETADLF